MKRFLAAAALVATTTLPALSFDLADMSEDEKQAFGEAVREYLMANPEVLVESINVLEERRAADSAQNDKVLVQNNLEEIFNDGHSWVGGNPEGDITLVEFVDYRCGFCRRVNPELEAVIKDDGNIRFVIKEFPIVSQESDLASRFAIAVHQLEGDELYKKAHDALMVMRAPVTLESLTTEAEGLGVDAQAIINRMQTEDVSAVLRKNRQLAERMGISGTPTFVIGPDMLRGVPQNGLAAAVEQARKNAEAG